MSGEEGAERTQEATQKRKDDARDEGRIVTSKEMFVMAALVAGTGLLAMLPAAMSGLAAGWAGYLRLEDAAHLDALVAARLSAAVWHVLIAGMAVGVPILGAVLMVQWAMGGVRWAPKALGFKFEKLDPLAGLGRLVSVQALVELGKSILKVVILGAIAAKIVLSDLPQIDRLWMMEAGPALAVIGDLLLRLMFAFCLGLAAIGGLDLFWQIHSLNKSLMMTVQETKEESKEQNGSPEVKGRLRRMQMEASRRGSRQRAALSDVPQATAIITNPIHFAVALRYVPGEMAAPVILAMGRGPMAAEIRKRAKASGVRIVPIPPLARALYYTGDIGTEIAEGLFAAVAAVLAHVYRLDRGEAAEMPDIDLPPEMRFTPWGGRG